MSKWIDLTGQKFGRLLIIERAKNNKWGGTMWFCSCNCGNEKVVSGASLRRGFIKSCGCLRDERAREVHILSYGLANMRATIHDYKRGAKERGLAWNLTEEQFKGITQKNCYYCGAEPNNKKKMRTTNGVYTYNGIDRVDNTKGYTIDNVVPCCKRCNRAKDIYTLQEFQDWIKRVYKHIQ